MEPAQYTQYIAKLEELARTNPAVLRSRVKLLVAAGYGYVLAILVGTIGAATAIVWLIATSHSGGIAFKLVLALLVLAWLILKSMFVKIEPPTGTPLVPDMAPRLVERVETIRQALDAPHADHVLLTDDFNAAVVQVPRLGILGWPTTYLVLGVPLMFALEQEQFDAVLAHEFAHLSGAHPKLGLWVFRMSRTWQQLLTHLEASRSWGSRLFERFVAWYSPRLHAYGLVMSRRDEYEADAEAARTTSPQAMAAALANMDVRGRHLARTVWPEIWRQAKANPTAPMSVWTNVVGQLRGGEDPTTRTQRLERALKRQSLADDTHPSLADRLRALVGAEPVSGDVAAEPSASAGEHYFGDQAANVLKRLDREWHESVAEPWKAIHDELRTLSQRAEELKRRDDEGALDVEATYELGQAILQTENAEMALPYLHRVLATSPNHAGANFVVGQELLWAGDPGGIEHVRRAMTSDQAAGPACTRILREFYAEHGDAAGVGQVEQERHDLSLVMRAAASERNDVRKRDTLVRTELAAANVDAIRRLGAATKGVSAIWVARKVTKLLPERPFLVVVVATRFWKIGFESKPQALAQRIAADLELSVDVDVMIYVLTGHTAWLYRRVKKIDGARVYDRRRDK